MDQMELRKAIERGRPRTVFDGEEYCWKKCKRQQFFEHHLQIVETKPMFRTVKMVCKDDRNIDFNGNRYPPQRPVVERDKNWRPVVERTYTLAMPYMQYYLMSYGEFKSPRVTWSPEPLQHYEQPIYIPLLPNVYGGGANPYDDLGSICLGMKVNDASEVCHFFWNTVFTPDEYRWYYKRNKWPDEGETVLERTLRSFSHWCELSKEASEPMEVFEGIEQPNLITYKSLNLH